MSADTVSPDPVESTRKNGEKLHSELLRWIADVTQERAANCMGVSASTVSRLKQDLGQFAHLLAALGLQIAATDSVVVDREDQRALKRMALNYLRADLENDSKTLFRE